MRRLKEAETNSSRLEQNIVFRNEAYLAETSGAVHISYFNHIVIMIEITEGQLGKFAVRCHVVVEETMICIQLILLCCPVDLIVLCDNHSFGIISHNSTK